MIQENQVEDRLNETAYELKKLSFEFNSAVLAFDLNPDSVDLSYLDGLYSRLIIYLDRYKELFSILHGSADNLPHLEEMLSMKNWEFHNFKKMYNGIKGNIIS